MRALGVSALVGACVLTVAAAQDRWASLGPDPLSSGPYTGRVAAIACSRVDQNLVFVGGADGGVWRTRDGGVSWTPLGDHLPSTAIGALALDPSDENIVYAGLGEANYANHSRYGLGLARSSDGGQTWRILAADTFSGRCFARIRIDPGRPSTLYAAIAPAGGFPARAAAREHPLGNGPLGVFKSVDSGVTWQHLRTGLPARDATDVTLDPANPSIVYAGIGDIFGHAENGVYRSLDGGASWAKLAGGLPGSGVGRVTLAVAPSQATRMYASLVRPSDSAGGGASTLGVYRSDDRGATWTNLTTVGSYQATYGWYLCTSVVHPGNPDAFYAGGFSLRRTQDGGASWSTITPPHVDLHALEFDAGGRLWCGNDGGVHRSANLGSAWQQVNNTLGLVQFYAGLSVHPTNRDLVYGGTQDNGTNRRSGSTNSWASVLGGDGGYTGIDPTGVRVFAESQGTGNLYRSVNGGSFSGSSSGISGRNCFLPPYEIHPQNGLHMVYGTERVFRSTDGGSSWTAISPDLTGGGVAAVRALAYAPSDLNTIYAATNDGRVQVTRNGGGNWQLVLTGVPGWPRVMRALRVHQADPQRAYLAVAAFGVDQVRYTADAGQSWRSLDGDLPDVPVSTVALDHSRGEPPILFVGTDRGVWRSVDHGKKWESYAPGLPNSPVIDLLVEPANARVLAATQGRGLWSMRLMGRDERATYEVR